MGIHETVAEVYKKKYQFTYYSALDDYQPILQQFGKDTGLDTHSKWPVIQGLARDFVAEADMNSWISALLSRVVEWSKLLSEES